MDHIGSQNHLINDSCFQFERETVNRIFKVGDRFIVYNLKELCRIFGPEWNLVSTRNILKTYLATVLVVKYLMLVLISGNHYLLREVVLVVGLLVLKI